MSSQAEPRVFVANWGGHDYSDAQRFGTLVPVTSDRVNLFATDRLEMEMQRVLGDANPTDYLLVSGSPVVNTLCAGFLLRRLGRLRLLIWDARGQRYMLRETGCAPRACPAPIAA